MKLPVKALKSLHVALKELEPHIRQPTSLRRGRPFKTFKMLPRELLGNWLVCAVGNFERGTDDLKICNDPFGGDGVILDITAGSHLVTEHVYVPPPRVATDLEGLIIGAVNHKGKRGKAYARGKVLIVFSEARGKWFPNKVARRLHGIHGFEDVWVVHRGNVPLNEFGYSAALLDLSDGEAPAWEVQIRDDFCDWHVCRVQ